MGSIRKINKSEINLDKIYSTKSDATNQTNSKIAHVNSWDGDLEIKMTDDPNVGLVMKNGQALGFINLIDSNAINQYTNNTDVSFDSEEFLNQQKSSAHNAKLIKPGMMSEEYEIPIKENEFKGKNDSSNGGKKLVKPSEQVEEEYSMPKQYQNSQANKKAKPEDFNFRYGDSNLLAAKAKDMGFTDEQIIMAVGISRWETGNYEHLAGGFNYGGVTGNGDLGKTGKYAKYSSKDVGMDAFLKNLKKNYFDMGYSQIDYSFARKYVGDFSSDHLNAWIKGVNGCKK